MESLDARVVRSAGRTHVGLVRKLNEDAFLDLPDSRIWAVADGLGGHRGGDYASRTVIEHLRDAAARAGVLNADGVRQAIDEANREVRREIGRRGHVVASTVVILLMGERRFHCMWAGDSRLYLLRGGRLYSVSRDHSAVQVLVEQKRITPEEARTHRDANVVTRAVGAADAIDLDELQDTIAMGDVFLLCSDGLTKMVGDKEIEQVLADGPVTDAPERLLSLALGRGGGIDNVTVVTVGVVPAGSEEEIPTMRMPPAPGNAV